MGKSPSVGVLHEDDCDEVKFFEKPRKNLQSDDENVDERPGWLPDGWIMEVYRGDDGTICRYYICPFSGITFTMKSEVLHYLFSEMDQRFMESKNCAVGCNLMRTHEWLPKGWLVEIRAGGDNMDKMYKRRHLRPPPPSMSLQRGLDNTRSSGDHRRLGRATDIVRDAAEAHRPLDAVAGVVTMLTDLRSSLVSGKDMAGCSNGPVREVSTTDGAGDMRGEPHVDAGGVEHMAAPGEEAELLAIVHKLGEADRALERPMPGLHRPRCRRKYTAKHLHMKDLLTIVAMLAAHFQTLLEESLRLLLHFYVYPPDRVRLFSKDDILAILEFNPEGLPQGWVKEVVFRKTNTSRIRRDRHYTDPIKNYVFRTMRSAALYLETRKVIIRAFVQKTSVHEVYSFEKYSEKRISSKPSTLKRGTNQLCTQSSKLQKLSLKEEILSDEQGSSSGKFSVVLCRAPSPILDLLVSSPWCGGVVVLLEVAIAGGRLGSCGFGGSASDGICGGFGYTVLEATLTVAVAVACSAVVTIIHEDSEFGEANVVPHCVGCLM
uniref:MBD domain-containing protein n=1 Tax=Oryza rufipogon TaxID=4529 RepID=A0A0E0P5P1_ORYRU